jgi:hypothetical protein
VLFSFDSAKVLLFFVPANFSTTFFQKKAFFYSKKRSLNMNQPNEIPKFTRFLSEL